MKILYTSLYDPCFGLGGAEKVLLDLALAMRRDYGVSVCAAVNPGDLQRELFKQGIEVTPIPWAKWRTPAAIFNFKKAIEKYKPDLVHSHHRFTTFLLDWLFKNRIPVLHTEHVLRSDKSVFFRCGHKATAVHESVRQNLIRHYAVPPEDVVTIPNAVACPISLPDRVRELTCRFKKRSGQFHVLFIGRLELQKGHRYLIEAVMRMPELYRKRLMIYFAGEGSLEAELKAQIKSFQLESCFHFLGYKRHIADYLDFCDFIVLPSLWEGMPLVVLEAAAMGRAVIATDIPGTRETIRQGVTGVLVPPKNGLSLARAMMDWMDHPETIRRMGVAAKQFSEHEFSFAVMMERYYKLYQVMSDA